MNTAHFATEQDYLNGRKLIGFRVVVNPSKFTIQPSNGEVEITKSTRNGVLRSMYGSIDYVELGVLRMSSETQYSFTGYLVDYADNKASALQAAKVAAMTKHDEYVARMTAELRQLKDQILTQLLSD